MPRKTTSKTKKRASSTRKRTRKPKTNPRKGIMVRKVRKKVVMTEAIKEQLELEYELYVKNYSERPHLFLLAENGKHIVVDMYKLYGGSDGCSRMPDIDATEMTNAYIFLAKKGLQITGIARVGNLREMEGKFSIDSGPAAEFLQYVLTYDGVKKIFTAGHVDKNWYDNYEAYCGECDENDEDQMYDEEDYFNKSRIDYPVEFI